MGVRTRATLLAAVMVMAGCAGSEEPSVAPTSPAASSSPAAFTPPPLRLPVVRSGERCPVSAVHAWTGWGQAGRVLGDGPLYPIADYFRIDGATLDLRPDDRNPDGTYGKKVRWLGVGYVGPVVLRAARIDGPGRAVVRWSGFGELRGDTYFADLTQAENDLPATTTVSGPGCFAYQVDGVDLHRTIVFRAVTVG